MSKRLEFSKRVRLDRWMHAAGKCESCGILIRPGNGPEYDHDNPDRAGGANDFENCRCLCVKCHRAKTKDIDTPVITKVRRSFEKRIGARRSSRPFPTRPKDQQWGRQRDE